MSAVRTIPGQERPAVSHLGLSGSATQLQNFRNEALYGQVTPNVIGSCTGKFESRSDAHDYW
jgi:hypothetical protein